jgi:hypothetical protein
MKFARSVCPVVLVALLLSLNVFASTPSWSYENSKIGSGEIQIRTACMMPAEGKLSKLGMKGREGMSKESEAWSVQLQNIVESHLNHAGVSVVPALGTPASNASDDEVNQLVLRIQGKYDEIHGQIEKKPKDIGKDRYTLGDEVALLPCDAKADVLVFVSGSGQVLTGGKKAMGILVGGAKDSTAHLALSMADAKTGEILAFVRMNNAGKFVDDSEKAYGKALDKQFGKMKIGSNPGGKKKKK